MQLLAGLIDTDGSEAGGYYDYLSASKALAEGVLQVSRSLGFAAYMHSKRIRYKGEAREYWRISISGDVSEIPVLVERKKAAPRRQKKSVLRTGFSVEAVGEEPFFGFELDGDGRYLLEDYTVCHNTEVAMSIVFDMAAKGTRCMFVADRQTLVSQTSQRFAGAGIAHGVLMGQNTFGEHERILVCSAQTIERRGWPANLPDLVFFDECHEIRKALVETAKERDLRLIGLSATPLTVGLDKWYETIVNVTTTSKLIGDGYLAPLKVVGPKTIVDTDGLAVSAGEWKKDELSERVLRIVGDLVPTWQTKTEQYFGGPVQTIVFCPSVADSCRTADAFQEEGYDFRVIHYHQKPEEKQAIIERFRKGEHIGLVSCVVLTKGFDVPGTRCLIDAYPLRKSLSMHIQKLGRVMRRAEGKEFGLLLDHAENFQRFYTDAGDFFDNGCTTFVTAAAKKKKKKKEELEREKKARKCEDCEIILGPTEYKCPECGKDYMTKRDASILRYGAHMDLVAELIGDRQLALIDRDEGAKADDLQWWWREICAAATDRYPLDFKRGKRVAYAVFKNTFGVWPESRFRITMRPPHPSAAALLNSSYKRWQHNQKAERLRGKKSLA